MKRAKANFDFFDQVAQEFGRVILTEGDTFIVRTESGDFRAKTAAGCLLIPGLGDLVLLASSAGQGSYILSVLERPAGASSKIHVQGDLELEVSGGRLEMTADSGIDLRTSKYVAVEASTLDATAARATLKAAEIDVWGVAARVRVEAVSLAAASLDATVKRVFQRLKRSFRMVEESEVVRAGRVEVQADNDLSLRGRQALVTAESLVKVDAEQIHLG